MNLKLCSTGLMAVVAILGTLSPGASIARAGVPTATPTATATPIIDLAAPDVYRYDEVTNVIFWVDLASGEDGYRIVVTIGRDTRTFEVGPDVEQVQLPDDFRPSCPDSPNVTILVRAFSGTLEGQSTTFFSIADCAPAGTITPSPTATSAPSLPATGAGGTGSASPVLPVSLALVAAAAGAGGLAVAVRRRQRP